MNSKQVEIFLLLGQWIVHYCLDTISAEELVPDGIEFNPLLTQKLFVLLKFGFYNIPVSEFVFSNSSFAWY